MKDPFKKLFLTPAGRAFAEAAKKVEAGFGDNDFWCCLVLKNEELCETMHEWYQDRPKHWYTTPGALSWMSGIGGFFDEGLTDPYDDAERQGRVLALCFMAALADAGDL